MGKEEQLLTTSIRNHFREAEKVVAKMTHLVLNNLHEADEPGDPSPLEFEEDALEWHLDQLYRKVAVLAERMSVPLTAARVLAERDKLTEKDLRKTDMSPHDDFLFSAQLSRIRGHFDALAVMTQGTEVTGLDVFRNILENTPAIMELTGVDPQKESDVQREVMKVLRIAFPGAEREPSISQVFKHYQPDFGVRSLMAAAEYKFASTLDEVKHALDGIYTDMKGYSGHYDWRTFFAVIYTTDTIVNPKEIEAEFAGVRAELSWTPIVVVGKGQRKPRRSRAKQDPPQQGN